MLHKCVKTREPKDEHCVLWCTYIRDNIHDCIPLDKLKNHTALPYITLDIKPIYSNPYRPQGNSRLENAHNFLKHPILKFLHDSTLEWDDILPIVVYIYNIAPSINDLESPFFLVLAEIHSKAD